MILCSNWNCKSKKDYIRYRKKNNWSAQMHDWTASSYTKDYMIKCEYFEKKGGKS